MAAEIDLGGTASAVGELERLVAEHPLRERLWALLALAHYRSGRQGDALATLERARTVLADELGVDPGPELRQLHQQVLEQDPVLDGVRRGARCRQAWPRRATPLVGRDVELADVAAGLGAGAGGAPGLGAGARAQRSGRHAARDASSPQRWRPRGTTSGWREGRARPGPAAPGPEPDAAGPALVVRDEAAAGPRRVGGAEPQPGCHGAAGTTRLRAGGRGGGARPPPARARRRPRGGGGLRRREHLTSAAAEVLAASDGWPAAVHEHAVAVGRRVASARVAVAAGLAERTTITLASARSDSARASSTVPRSAPSLPGPAAMATARGAVSRPTTIDDAPWFSGRERLVAELVAHWRSRAARRRRRLGQRQVLGAAAGVLAALAADALPGSAGWQQVVLRPGVHPMRELARLGPAGPSAPTWGTCSTRLLDGRGRATQRTLPRRWTSWRSCGRRATTPASARLPRHLDRAGPRPRLRDDGAGGGPGRLRRRRWRSTRPRRRDRRHDRARRVTHPRRGPPRGPPAAPRARACARRRPRPDDW